MHTISRRDYVRTAGALTAAATIAGASQAVAAEGTDGIAWDHETDVLVVGCGTAGCAAALEAYDAGADVLIVEKYDWMGGTLRRCGGGVAAADTQVQRALGVKDNPEDFFQFIMKGCEGYPNEELVRDWTMNSASVIDWLIDDLGGLPADQWGFSDDIEGGLEYSHDTGLNVGTPTTFDEIGMSPVPRTHWFPANEDDPILAEPEKYFYYPSPGGTGLWQLVNTAMDKRGIQTLTETTFASLITADGSNEVIGAVCESGGSEIRIKARKAVILACGNFASNKELFRNYTGEDYEPNAMGGMGIDLPTDNDGSGILAAQALGAELVFPSLVGKNHDTPTGFSAGMAGVKVDLNGRVIDVFGKEIPRLYAAGLTAGGIIVKNYPCCGSSVSRSLSFGRKSGTDAAKLESWS